MSVSGSIHRSATALWPLNRLFALVEVRSMVLGFVVVLALLVLAYFTNPNESSFRAFLTEQSFRQHLSRLDDTTDEFDVLRSYSSDSALTTPSRKGTSLATKQKRNSILSPSSYASSPSLHFSGRASVSLRTPKHVFRSFGILSIAAIVPSANRKERRRSSVSETGRSRDGMDVPNGTSGSTVESWFVGAFGMWWLAAHYDGFWYEAGGMSKDEDGTSSGLLDIKALDHNYDHNRIKHPHNVPIGQHQHQRTAPKLRTRSRERLSNGQSHGQGHLRIANGHIGHRSSSPPPLPKSASLPLHTKRPPASASTNDLQHNHNLQNGIGYDISHTFGPGLQPPLHAQLSHAHSHSARPVTTSAAGEDDTTRNSSNLSLSNTGLNSQVVSLSDSPQSISTLFSNSPKIVELLRQLEVSRASLADIHSQLSDAQASATASHASLTEELESQRARKRSDDAARTDLKARTRALEEAKRSAESVRRDAEKRLKVARSARDGVKSRSDRLKKEVEGMGKQMEGYGAEIVRSGVEASAVEKELSADVEKRRKEVKELEEEVVGLGSQVRQMEESLEAEKQRLKNAEVESERKAKEREKEREEMKKDMEKEMLEQSKHFGQTSTGVPVWQHGGFADKSMNVTEGADVQPLPLKGPSLPQDHSGSRVSPGFIPRRLSAASSQGFIGSPPEMRPTLSLSPAGPTAPEKGYSIFDEDIASLQQAHLSTSHGTGSVGFQFSNNNPTYSFSPFAKPDGFPTSASPGGVISPVSSSLIPSSLIETLGIGPGVGVGVDDAPISGDLVNAASTPIERIEASRSFQSENDIILERDWQSKHSRNIAPGSPSPNMLGGTERTSPDSLSPVSSRGNAMERDPFEVRMPPAAAQQQRGYDEFGMFRRMDSQRATMGMPGRTQLVVQDFSVPHAPEQPTPSADHPAMAKDTTSRWIFSKEKKRLNPDAKAFSLSKETERMLLSKSANSGTTATAGSATAQSVPSFDMIKNTFTTPPLVHSQAALSSSASSAKSTPSVSPFAGSWFGTSRAFAPSPEEREKLRRALGGSNNTSLDQLSNLSDVGSLPASPKPGYVSHAHGHPHVHAALNGSTIWGSESSSLKSRLTFSPFADDEPSPPPPSQLRATAVQPRGSPDSSVGADPDTSNSKSKVSRLKALERSTTN